MTDAAIQRVAAKARPKAPWQVWRDSAGRLSPLRIPALAITSTDGMVRRIGGRKWQHLHNIIYGIGLLALIHYFQQTKADVSVPTFVAGLFAWMLGYRLLLKFRKTRDEPPAWMLLALTAVIAALVFIAEAIGIGIVFNVSPFRVLGTAFDFDDLAMIRPGWLVFGAGLIVVELDLVRARFGRRRAPVRATPA